MVLNQNAKESEGEIINYVSCNVVHYKRVRVLQWTQKKTLRKGTLSGSTKRRGT